MNAVRNCNNPDIIYWSNNHKNLFLAHQYRQQKLVLKQACTHKQFAGLDIQLTVKYQSSSQYIRYCFIHLTYCFQIYCSICLECIFTLEHTAPLRNFRKKRGGKESSGTDCGSGLRFWCNVQTENLGAPLFWHMEAPVSFQTYSIWLNELTKWF